MNLLLSLSGRRGRNKVFAGEPAEGSLALFITCHEAGAERAEPPASRVAGLPIE